MWSDQNSDSDQSELYKLNIEIKFWKANTSNLGTFVCKYGYETDCCPSDYGTTTCPSWAYCGTYGGEYSLACLVKEYEPNHDDTANGTYGCN